MIWYFIYHLTWIILVYEEGHKMIFDTFIPKDTLSL